MHKSDFKRIDITLGNLNIFENNFPSFIIKAEEKQSGILIDFGQTLIIPIKNKLFFIWEEIIRDKNEINQDFLHKLLLQIIEPIFSIEEI